jgi:hypothetical protein
MTGIFYHFFDRSTGVNQLGKDCALVIPSLRMALRSPCVLSFES